MVVGFVLNQENAQRVPRGGVLPRRTTRHWAVLDRSRGYLSQRYRGRVQGESQTGQGGRARARGRDLGPDQAERGGRERVTRRRSGKEENTKRRDEKRRRYEGRVVVVDGGWGIGDGDGDEDGRMRTEIPYSCCTAQEDILDYICTQYPIDRIELQRTN